MTSFVKHRRDAAMKFVLNGLPGQDFTRSNASSALKGNSRGLQVRLLIDISNRVMQITRFLYEALLTHSDIESFHRGLLSTLEKPAAIFLASFETMLNRCFAPLNSVFSAELSDSIRVNVRLTVCAWSSQSHKATLLARDSNLFQKLEQVFQEPVVGRQKCPT